MLVSDTYLRWEAEPVIVAKWVSLHERRVEEPIPVLPDGSFSLVSAGKLIQSLVRGVEIAAHVPELLERAEMKYRCGEERVDIAGAKQQPHSSFREFGAE